MSVQVPNHLRICLYCAEICIGSHKTCVRLEDGGAVPQTAAELQVLKNGRRTAVPGSSNVYAADLSSEQQREDEQHIARDGQDRADHPVCPERRPELDRPRASDEGQRHQREERMRGADDEHGMRRALGELFLKDVRDRVGDDPRKYE